MMSTASRATAVLLCLLLAGCHPAPPPTAGHAPAPDKAAAAPAGAPIVLGAVFPLSAGAGRIGQMKQQGADLAVRHLNAAGGVKGRPLKIVYVDSKNQANEARVGFDKLVDLDQVSVVMAAMSQVCMTLADAADKRHVVLYANASHPELTKKSAYVFRNLPTTAKNATAMAQTAAKELGLKRIAVLYLNDEYGAEARRIFEQTFAQSGGTISGTEAFDRTATDLRTQLGKLAQGKPEAWWIPGYGSALGLALKQKGELQLPGRVLCDLGVVDANVLQTAGAAAERVVVVAPQFDAEAPDPKVQTFTRDFVAEYKEVPSFDAAFQYDAVGLIAEAYRTAKTTNGPGLREALAAIHDYAGICGPTSFAGHGDADLPVSVRMLLGGKLVPLDAAPTPAAAPTPLPK